MNDEVSVQSIRSNRSAERDRSYSLDSRHSRDSQSRDEQGTRDRRLGYNADSRQNRERDRDRDRGRERNRDHHGSVSRGHGTHRDDRGRDSRSHYESRDRDTRAPDRRSSEPTERRERSVSASRDGSGTTAAGTRTRESSADRSRTAGAGAGVSSRGRSASPHAPRDKTSCECLDTSIEYVQVCEYLNTVTSRTVLQEEDCLLAASLPHPADPNNPDLPRLFVECLPDTGAWSANYINEATAEWLQAMGVKRQECRVSVCSGIGTSQQFCVPCGGTYTFLITIYNDLLEGDETLSITANEIPSVYAVLLGRKTIKEHNISLKCFRFFSNLETGASLRGFVSYNLYATVYKPQLCNASTTVTAAAKPQATMVVRNGGVARYAETETRPKSDFLSPEPDEDFVDPEDEYYMPWEETDRESESEQRPVQEDGTFAASIGLEVTGSAEFITDANLLIEEFQDIFSSDLGKEPADLPLLDVTIDTAKWHSPRNQGRARNQSVEGQQEVRRHVETLLDCGAISPVMYAPAYSQVLLVKKPDTDEKRLVLDYRALNECVGHMNWPLPNIVHMMERIGALKPKKFAKFDMTKGY